MHLGLGRRGYPLRRLTRLHAASLAPLTQKDHFEASRRESLATRGAAYEDTLTSLHRSVTARAFGAGGDGVLGARSPRNRDVARCTID